MKVELESPLKRALLKGCLWMGEHEGSSGGELDEDNQQFTASTMHCSMEENEAMSLFD